MELALIFTILAVAIIIADSFYFFKSQKKKIVLTSITSIGVWLLFVTFGYWCTSLCKNITAETTTNNKNTPREIKDDVRKEINTNIDDNRINQIEDTKEIPTEQKQQEEDRNNIEYFYEKG